MKTLGLRPTIYAFNRPVPSFIRWPMMVLACAAMGFVILVPAIIIVPPVAILVVAIIGVAYLILKYYFKRKRSHLEPQPAN